jgi:WD40 repeat protein
VRIWELSTGRQLQNIVTGPQWVSFSQLNGPKLTFLILKLQKNRLQITFSWNEDFVLTPDENTHSVVVWDVRTGEAVQKLTGHTNVIPWIASSRVEPALLTCR